MSSRYKIGIDLGTSNCALSYVDTLSDAGRTEVLSIPQLIAESTEDSLPLLPSFLYLATEEERESGRYKNPIDLAATSDSLFGVFAREQGVYQSDRVVSSAKSWLCYGGVERDAPLLPWGSESIASAERRSPIDVSAQYLRYLREAWNCSVGKIESAYRFENQEVVITVPASFDEAAQRLTLEAAKRAGFPETVLLLEEPQAAFYHWLERHDTADRSELLSDLAQDGICRILICDVGGGTSDFSLFEVSFSDSATPVMTRSAVSDHILLGGDNIDLAIAHFAEQKLKQDNSNLTLSSYQWNHLLAASRSLKERIFEEDSSSTEYGVSVPSQGSSLFGGSLSTRLSRAELEEIVLEGFYPMVDAEDRPRRASSALRDWGLPYAHDSAVTRHLAAFLEGERVDAVLFNGGSLAPAPLRARLEELLSNWHPDAAPRALDTKGMELAVARGAAHYLRIREDDSERIRAGYARSVYLALEDVSNPQYQKAICLLPQGASVNERLRLEGRKFEALVDRPVKFQLLTSTHRAMDAAGDIVEQPREVFHQLPPLQTVLPSKTKKKGKVNDEFLEVELETEVNSLGLLQVSCVHSESERWELDFSTRAAEEQGTVAAEQSSDGASPQVDADSAQALEKARHIFLEYYGKGKKGQKSDSPKNLTPRLEEVFASPREEWTTELCRSLWSVTEKGITKRARSVQHEAAWLYLAGYILRPGFGAELDEWRIDQLWRLQQLGMSFPKENQSVSQWWILWRRISAGLSRERQLELFASAKKSMGKKGSDSPELYRLLGTLDELPVQEKNEIIRTLLKRISGRKTQGIEHYIWALGRLASRVSLNGKIHTVLPPSSVEPWLSRVLELDWTQGDLRYLNSAMSQIVRVTGDRARDFSEEVRERVSKKLLISGANEEQLRLLRELVEVDSETENRFFGETLPLGIRLQGSANE